MSRKRETPPHEAVASSPNGRSRHSSERESPPDKPVASPRLFTQSGQLVDGSDPTYNETAKRVYALANGDWNFDST